MFLHSENDKQTLLKIEWNYILLVFLFLQDVACLESTLAVDQVVQPRLLAPPTKNLVGLSPMVWISSGAVSSVRKKVTVSSALTAALVELETNLREV